MDKNSTIVVLGAGPCGLAVGWGLIERGFTNVTLLEQNDKVGGLFRSEVIANNVYEYGAHYFHSDDRKIIHKIIPLLNKQYSVNKRDLLIKFHGKYFKYPLKANDIIMGFNFLDLCLFFLSMLYALLKNKIFPKKFTTAEDVLVAKYGKRLFHKFFEGYIVDFWAVHPSQLSASFAERRISRMDALELIKKFLSLIRIVNNGNKSDEFIEVVEGFLYYPHQGIGEIAQKISAEILRRNGRIVKSAILGKIEISPKGRAESITYTVENKQNVIRPQMIISTIPLVSLLNAFSDCDGYIRKVADNLEYRSLIIIGMLVSREKILPSFCTYYHNRVFSRISEPKIAGLKVCPAEYTVIYLEISCSINDEVWNNPELVMDNVYRELEEENLLRKEEVKEYHILKERFAYPVFNLSYERNVEEIKTYLKRVTNVFSTGRQGLFQYINAHVAFKMGFAVAELISSGNINKDMNSPYYY